MDRKPFQPADGVTPRWQKLYQLVTTKEVGDQITYVEAGQTVGLDDRSRSGLASIQQAMRTAMAHLEKDGQRTVGNVTQFGWIVLDAAREIDQVDRRADKTRRAGVRTLRGADALDTRRDELDQFGRQRLDWVRRSATVAAQVLSRRSRKTPEELRKMLEQ